MERRGTAFTKPGIRDAGFHFVNALNPEDSKKRAILDTERNDNRTERKMGSDQGVPERRATGHSHLVVAKLREISAVHGWDVRSFHQFRCAALSVQGSIKPQQNGLASHEAGASGDQGFIAPATR
jgi:hypothetical protein